MADKKELSEVAKRRKRLESGDERESENDPNQRRMYVLPKELVERVTAFQKSQGLPSEVEAVRRLLDEALMHRDDIVSISERCHQQLKKNVFLPDIVRNVIIGHPLISEVRFEGDEVHFGLKNGDTGRLSKVDGVAAYNMNGNKVYPDPFDPEADIPF